MSFFGPCRGRSAHRGVRLNDPFRVARYFLSFPRPLAWAGRRAFQARIRAKRQADGRLRRKCCPEIRENGACPALPFFGVRRFPAALICCFFSLCCGKTKERKRRKSAALQKEATPPAR